MANEYLVTSDGLVALQNELEELKTVKRKEVAEKIKEARSFGDLSENSEYDEAKNEQGIVESRIAELEGIMKIVKVVDDTETSGDMVGIGSHVKYKCTDGTKGEYDIVSSTEADPMNGKISDESPIGVAVKGHHKGETVEVLLPNGKINSLKILAVERKA